MNENSSAPAATSARALVDIAIEASQRAAEIESLRRLPTDLVDALASTGVFKRLVPTAYGGSQAHIWDGHRDIESVSYHDGSTGWCVMIGMTTGLGAGLLPPEHAHALFGPVASIGGGFAMPAGRARMVDGGLRVTGRWAWGSGTDHCTVIGGGVLIVDDDDRPSALSDGTRAPFVYFDPVDVEVLDTWHATGLKGSASGDYTVTDASAPEGRWIDITRPTPVIDDPLYRFPFVAGLGVGVASVMLGLGRRAIDELIAIGEKVPTGSSSSLAERAAVAIDIARADAAVRSARSFLHEVIDEIWERVVGGDRASDEQRRLLRLACTDAAERSAYAVGLCYHAAGGTSVFESSPLQRIFRDVHVATQHGMVAPRTLETIGRMTFGAPLGPGAF